MSWASSGCGVRKAESSSEVGRLEESRTGSIPRRFLDRASFSSNAPRVAKCKAGATLLSTGILRIVSRVIFQAVQAPVQHEVALFVGIGQSEAIHSACCWMICLVIFSFPSAKTESARPKTALPAPPAVIVLRTFLLDHMTPFRSSWHVFRLSLLIIVCSYCDR